MSAGRTALETPICPHLNDVTFWRGASSPQFIGTLQSRQSHIYTHVKLWLASYNNKSMQDLNFSIFCSIESFLKKVWGNVSVVGKENVLVRYSQRSKVTAPLLSAGFGCKYLGNHGDCEHPLCFLTARHRRWGGFGTRCPRRQMLLAHPPLLPVITGSSPLSRPLLFKGRQNKSTECWPSVKIRVSVLHLCHREI